MAIFNSYVKLPEGNITKNHVTAVKWRTLQDAIGELLEQTRLVNSEGRDQAHGFWPVWVPVFGPWYPFRGKMKSFCLIILIQSIHQNGCKTNCHTNCPNATILSFFWYWLNWPRVGKFRARDTGKKRTLRAATCIWNGNTLGLRRLHGSTRLHSSTWLHESLEFTEGHCERALRIQSLPGEHSFEPQDGAMVCHVTSQLWIPPTRWLWDVWEGHVFDCSGELIL